VSEEEWRPIPGFADYSVSNLGRVRSTRRGEEQILTGGYTGAGYRKVAMTGDDGHRYGRKVHHLVAEAFLGPRPPGAHVRHLDDVKTNNAASNLAYGSKSDNTLDAVRNGLHANAAKTHCRRDHPYDDRNTYVSRTGRRQCRACARERYRAA
jgi:HNH endonuclease/NUMOD4 motif